MTNLAYRLQEPEMLNSDAVTQSLLYEGIVSGDQIIEAQSESSNRTPALLHISTAQLLVFVGSRNGVFFLILRTKTDPLLDLPT